MILQFLKRRDEGFPHVSNFELLAFFVYVNIWYLQFGIRIPALGAIRIEFLWAVFLIVLIFLNREKVSLLSGNPMAGVTLLLFLVMAVQVPFSHVPAHSWNVFFNRVIKFAFMAFFIVHFVRSPKGLIVFLCAFMLACMKMGQEGLIGQITGNMVWENQGIMRLHGSTPMYSHPNSYTGMALGTIPFVIYLFPIAPKLFKVLLAAQFLFAFNIIIHTGSRTGYVAFMMMLMFVILASRRKAAAVVTIILFTVVSLHYIDQQYFDRLSTVVSGEEIEGDSMGTRMQIIEDAVEVFISNPLGVGVGAFPAVRSAMFGRGQDTHNLYLEVATNLGVQGLIVFLLFVYKMLRVLHEVRCRAEKERKRLQMEKGAALSDPSISGKIENLLLLEAVSKAVFLFVLVRLSLGIFGMDLYEIYWWFSLGLTISLYTISKKICE